MLRRKKPLSKRKTAGELQNALSSDFTKYDPLEVGHALTQDIAKQLQICAEAHDKIFDEDEYCLVRVVAGDPLLKNIRRHKYYGWLYLPLPRPQQSVFLYNKHRQTVRRLWSLPNALVMATISEMPSVAKQWEETKAWCDAFYRGDFHETIRDQHKISLLSEKEYLSVNRQKLVKAGCKDGGPIAPDAFDFSKVSVNQVIDPQNSSPE